MLFYDPNHKGSLDNIVGTAKVDEKIDVNKVIDSIHTKEGLY